MGLTAVCVNLCHDFLIFTWMPPITVNVVLCAIAAHMLTSLLVKYKTGELYATRFPFTFFKQQVQQTL